MERLAVAPEQLGARDALRWVLGMQVEGQPLDHGAEPRASRSAVRWPMRQNGQM